MNLTSLKTFVISVMNPSLWSLKFFYKAKYEEMVKLANTQNDTIIQLSTEITELKQIIMETQETIIGYEQEVHDINEKSYTAEQVVALEERERELNYICGALYDKVYELINTGTVEDPTLPDFDDPDMPGEDIETP